VSFGHKIKGRGVTICVNKAISRLRSWFQSVGVLPCKSVGSFCARQITCNQRLWGQRNQFVVLTQRDRWLLHVMVPDAISPWVCYHPIQSSSNSWSPSWNLGQIKYSSAIEWTTTDSSSAASYQDCTEMYKWRIRPLLHLRRDTRGLANPGEDLNSYMTTRGGGYSMLHNQWRVIQQSQGRECVLTHHQEQ
jgi:hypothetical protein